MKNGERDSKYNSYTTYSRPSSSINPLIANIFLLIIVSYVTIKSELVNLSVIFLISLIATVIFSKKPIQILKTMLIVTPFGIGLGLFYGIFGHKDLVIALPIIILRVEILVTASSILYYCVDPWELSSVLIDKMKFSPYFSYTIALAITVYQMLIRDLKEIIDSLRSKGIIHSQLEYIIKIHKILYMLVHDAARITEQIETTLEARNFNPTTRKTRKNLTIRLWEALLIIVTLATIILIEIC